MHQNTQKICRIILWTKKLLIYNCGDYEFVKVGIEVRKYIIKVQNGDMDDELEADLYDKLTKLTADDIQEVVEAIDN